MTAAGSLPGDIPGLLRRGSSCFIRDDLQVPDYLQGKACTIHAAHMRLASVAVDDRQGVVVISVHLLALDLTDVTARVHAQWWATSHPRSDLWPLLDMPRGVVFDVLAHRADDDAWWTEERLALLAEVVLRLAGRWS